MATDLVYNEIQLIGGIQPPPRTFSCWHDTVIVGYSGVPEIDGRDTAEWLEDFMFQKYNLDTLQQAVVELTAAVQSQRIKDESIGDAEPLLIYLAGYEQLTGQSAWRLYQISNLEDTDGKDHLQVSKYYQFCDILQKPLTPNILDFSQIICEQFPEEIFWIRDCRGSIQQKLIEPALRNLYSDAQEQVDDWQSFLKYAVTAAAAFESIFKPFEKDALSVELRSLSRPF